MTTALNLSAEQLRRAAALRERIDKLEMQLAAILGPASGSPATPAAERAARRKRRRKMSKEARAKQALAMKKRWAKVKAAGKKSL
ncbi:MAG: hypothetical protein KJ072_21020 [Verrucomicrobia bacterium]|nr:hypothetical protein [Verrucomicrobiota bacterium]